MENHNKLKIRNIGILAMAILFSASVVAPHASGDILGQGLIQLHQTFVPPPIKIVPPCNVSYKATTFVWNYSLVNNTLSGTLRIHVNFDKTCTSEFWNILKVINSGNLTGNMSVKIVKSAKIGDYFLNETYTSTVSVFMNHFWQTSSNPGTELLNNTTVGPFPLYPSDEVSYYIGVIYSEPPALPPEIQSDLNALGEYITFTFYIQL